MTAADVVNEVEGLGALLGVTEWPSEEVFAAIATSVDLDWHDAQETLEAWLWDVRAAKTDGGEDTLDATDRSEIHDASLVMLCGFLAGLRAARQSAAD